MKRFQRIGTQIVNRTGSGTMEAAVLHDPASARWSSSCSGRRTSRRTICRGEQGRCRPDRRRARRCVASCYGDEIVQLLDAQDLRVPEVDLTKDEAWPRL